MMEKTTGFCTMTYRFRLYCEKEDWLWKTKNLYNELLSFYYDILGKEFELQLLGKQQQLRQLEILTVGTKENRTAKYPIPWNKVPLYFRRAVINDAIRLYRSFLSGQEHGAKQTKKFRASPVYYKGMYRAFSEDSIALKLYDGNHWKWIECRIDTYGWTFPEHNFKNKAFCWYGQEKRIDGQMLSPLLHITKKRIMLHVPVQKTVSDIRTANERLAAGEKLCAVSFPSNDCMAVLVLLTANGEFLESKFIRGGDELAHRRRQILRKIQENRKAMGGEKVVLPETENKRWKEKIHRITDDMAHKVSREIITFCKQKEVSMVVLPNYKTTLNWNQLGYLSATPYDWIGRRLISYVKYKAFAEGIVPVTVSPRNTACRCYQCGASVKKYNGTSRPGERYFGGKNFICLNGHQGNAYFNAARNLGQKFLQERNEIKETVKI